MVSANSCFYIKLLIRQCQGRIWSVSPCAHNTQLQAPRNARRFGSTHPSEARPASVSSALQIPLEGFSSQPLLTRALHVIEQPHHISIYSIFFVHRNAVPHLFHPSSIIYDLFTLTPHTLRRACVSIHPSNSIFFPLHTSLSVPKSFDTISPYNPSIPSWYNT